MKEAEIKQLKKTLESELESLIFKDVHYSEEFNLNEEDRSDEVDQANADVSNASRLRFRNRENFYKRKIEKSLMKINEGSYGSCEDCESDIGFKRLVARPTAELCILCKEENERDEFSSISGRKSKSLGQTINLVGHL